MRYMGWGWEDLCAAPPEIVKEIVRIINEQNDKGEV